ncbi:hypothetical protein GGR54DRAFT_429189 [Hypoxylon sp. NC1633]|nr:hypothetical protein GGR54DRAFT_429189 [Hypoxylon sp. NC1633]
MVGVAGKSKACNTCRIRRVKCDMRRPCCLKCINSKRPCGGYSRDVVFVNRTPTAPEITAPLVLSELRAQQHTKDIRPNPRIEADLHYLFAESPHNSHQFRKYAVELLEATYLPTRPVSSSSRPEIGEGSFSWVYRLTDLAGPSKSLDTSLFAFCLAQLHVTSTGNASLYQCLDQYNTALQHLYSDLDNPEMRFREETLAAIIVLSTCELFVCPAENGWSVHAHGIAEILRLRDPEMASTPAWRHLFSRMRIVCTLEALTKRQAQILENDIWRQIVTESGISGALDEVYQMIADVPAILEQAAALPSTMDQLILQESAVVAQSILAMVKHVESWHDRFWKASRAPRAWSVPSSAVNPADVNLSDKIFPFCFEFESVSVAVPVVMCWSVAAQLYSNVIQIHNLVQARLGSRMILDHLLAQPDANDIGSANVPGSSGQGRSIQDIQSEGTKMARDVCQSLEYFHRVEMGTYGGHATTYPCWSVRQYFRLHPGHERERAWIQNMHKMEGPNTRWGLSMMTFPDIANSLDHAEQ